jgi:hypothetical protein
MRTQLGGTLVGFRSACGGMSTISRTESGSIVLAPMPSDCGRESGERAEKKRSLPAHLRCSARMPRTSKDK